MKILINIKEGMIISMNEKDVELTEEMEKELSNGKGEE